MQNFFVTIFVYLCQTVTETSVSVCHEMGASQMAAMDLIAFLFHNVRAGRRPHRLSAARASCVRPAGQ